MTFMEAELATIINPRSEVRRWYEVRLAALHLPGVARARAAATLHRRGDAIDYNEFTPFFRRLYCKNVGVVLSVSMLEVE